jgi:inosine-uridine nucleoside N-ribohydrolase
MPSQRVIIDSDPGIDDAQAILFAFLCQQFEIDAVTSIFGNVPVDLAALDALRLVELAGRPGVPVYLGAAEPLVQRRLHFAPTIHGDDGFGNVGWPLPAQRTAPGYAAIELARRVLGRRARSRSCHSDL